MLDSRGYVAEACSANFFAIFDNEIHTPIPDCFLDGITRQTVIEIAKKIGYKVIERRIELCELKNATDCFVTGTAAEVTRINSITTRDLNTVYRFNKSDISLKLISEYSKLTQE
jgi:branched-chain amino acid aminotransferase